MMFMHVVQAKYVDDFKVWVAFNDGASGEIDLASELDVEGCGEVFEPLQHVAFFNSFTLDGHTLSWRNGADFAPDFAQEVLRGLLPLVEPMRC